MSIVLVKPILTLGIENNWEEVKPSIEGRQWIDTTSIREDRLKQKTLQTNYMDINSFGNSKKIETFEMEVDCKGKTYRDITTNGIKNKNAQWQLSNGDTLIQNVIQRVCSHSFSQ